MSFNKRILILGANGTIGSSLFQIFQETGSRVFGTVRDEHKRQVDRLYLNLADLNSIKAFSWRDYEVIINCAGNIDYQNTLQALQNNIFLNTLVPLQILTQLTNTQHYFHCSSHVVTLPLPQQNSYSLSKMFFENCVEALPDTAVKVTLLRIPGVFDRQRDSGVIYLVKKHFEQKKPLELEWVANNWHVMYLPRLAKVISFLITNGCLDRVVPIGYPVETTIEAVIKTAEKVFGYSIPVSFKSYKTNHYKSGLTVEQKYINIGKKDFEADLIAYFQDR